LNGICRDDGSCSCDVKYNHIISPISDTTKFCENISSCKIYNPFCINCNNISCLDCENGYTKIINNCGKIIFLK
jgi:hypothetical protein